VVGYLHKDVHIQNPKPVVTSHDKRDTADVIKLRISAWGEYFRLSGWAKCKHKDPWKKKDAGASESEEEL